MQVIKQLKDISKNYNVLFCDIWGCIHNGKEAYQNCSKALVDFKRNNGFVMLLTNAPRPKNAVKAHLSTFGISENTLTTLQHREMLLKIVCYQEMLGPRYFTWDQKEM